MKETTKGTGAGGLTPQPDNRPSSVIQKRIKSIAIECIEGSSPYKSKNPWRESIFDKIPGPNENRFVPFNFRPSINSKYKKSEQTTTFHNQVTREDSIIGG